MIPTRVAESTVVRNIYQSSLGGTGSIFPFAIFSMAVGKAKAVAAAVVVCGRIRKIEGVKTHLQVTVVHGGHTFVAEDEKIHRCGPNDVVELFVAWPTGVIPNHSARTARNVHQGAQDLPIHRDAS